VSDLRWRNTTQDVIQTTSEVQTVCRHRRNYPWLQWIDHVINIIFCVTSDHVCARSITLCTMHINQALSMTSHNPIKQKFPIPWTLLLTVARAISQILILLLSLIQHCCKTSQPGSLQWKTKVKVRVQFQFQIMRSISRSFYCSSLRVYVFYQMFLERLNWVCCYDNL